MALPQARQIRHNVEGGWYPITTRGMGRREIFSSDRDREHFVELLQGLVERVTRYTLVGWSATKEADEVKSVIIRLLAAIGEADLRRIDKFLNDRPHKCLGWKAASLRPCRPVAAFPARPTLEIPAALCHNDLAFTRGNGSPASQRPVLHWPLAGGRGFSDKP